MKRHLLAAVAALSFLGPAAIAQTNSGSAPAMQNLDKLSAQEFVSMAASSDMFEIGSSKGALTRATHAEVKEFAEHMVTDHSKSSEELMANAKAEGLTVPADMMEVHEARWEKVNAMSGADFDEAYVDAQVLAHQEAVALFAAYAENGDNANLKAFAAKTLPTLQEHLRDVEKLDASIS